MLNRLVVMKKFSLKNYSPNNALIIMGWATLIGFSLLGLGLIYWVQAESLSRVFLSGKPLYLQILVGVGLGLLFGLIASLGAKKGVFEKTNKMVQNTFKHPKINHFHYAWVAFCAGVGEEICFRAGVQPLIGLLPTAIIFIALHGYLFLYKEKGFVLAVFFMLLLSVLLGLVFIYFGIFAAIILHAVYDYIVIWYVAKKM
jgi:hypothetical protein